MRRVLATALVGATLVAAGCSSFGPEQIAHLSAGRRVTLEVVDERGDPVAGAKLDGVGAGGSTDTNGRLRVDLSQPAAGLVSAAGKLSEPVLVAPTDGEQRIVLYDRVGEGGTRLALHFGGDVMMGRRYQDPGREGTAQAHSSEQARDVVSALAPVSAVADLTVVNVETVIGELPADESASGKRFLIQSPPQLIDALHELGVDAVTLGNNHANDWGDAGVLSTLSVLGPSGIAYAGAGMTDADAVRGIVLPIGEQRIGLISATTVDGNFVNDQLPVATDPVPPDLPAAEAWQYEQRQFGFGEAGEPGYIADAARVPGDAWRAFRDLEPSLSEQRAAELWAAITDPSAYPELQDWVARRGHGGAASATRAQIAAEISALRRQGADTVVVQFHAGFQFSERPSAGLRSLSRAAIDDGADMVVSHHPHVLQGFEWYQGRLIAYSLGNLIFDQDFLSTYPSAMLRVVVEGNQILEARAIPIALVDYRPLPVAGEAAERVVRLLDTRSMLPGVSDRVDGLEVGVVFDEAAASQSIPADVRLDRNTGVIAPTTGNRGERIDLELDAGDPVLFPACRTVRADLLTPGVEYATDLYGWGSFDDVTADGHRVAPSQWVVNSDSERSALVEGASGAPTDDALEIIGEANTNASARFVSRAQIEPHRWFDVALQPLDAAPTYTLDFDVRRTPGDAATIRFDVYDVQDVDPTSDPESVKIRTVEIPFSIPRSNRWTSVSIPIDPAMFAPDEQGRTVDAVLVTFITAKALYQEYQFDNVRLYEWRGAPSDALAGVPVWVAADAIRSDRDGTVPLTVTGCPTG